MKNNTHDTKSYLIVALQKLPDDFCLSEVKFHIKMALDKITTVEKKRSKREEAQKETPIPLFSLSPNEAKKAVEMLDQMINQEKGKIKKPTINDINLLD